MRITFVSPPVNLSGGTKVIAIHAEGLAQLGHVVRVISPPQREIPLRRRLRSLLRNMNGLQMTSALSSHLANRNIDHRVLDCYRPVTDADVPDGDVVIATWWETAEWVHALRPNAGAKVYFIQGHEIFPELPIARCRATYRLPLHKIVVSRWLKEIMATDYGDNQVDIVLNSVDHNQFDSAVRSKQPIPTVGFLHATSPVKGLDASLAAIRAVRKRFPDLRLVCFGTEIPNKATDLPTEAQFVHRPPQDQIRKLYAQCDAWLSASRSDGFNLPVIEAMACRTPAVATRTGWPAEALVTGRNGVLVDIDDVRGLQEGLEWILSLDSEKWTQLSSSARATATLSSWKASTSQFEAALIKACERASNGEIAGGHASAI